MMDETELCEWARNLTLEEIRRAGENRMALIGSDCGIPDSVYNAAVDLAHLLHETLNRLGERE